MKKSINICFAVTMLVLIGFLFTACSTDEETPVVPNPVFSLESCTFKGSTNVSITCSELGATIRYTTDGSTPTGSYGTIYTQPIEVNNTMLIKARAVKPSWEPSEVISVLYTVTGSVVNPTFSVSGGTYNTNLTVRMSCATPGVTIRYTTDGTMPTSTHGTILENTTNGLASYSVTKTTTLKAIAYRSDWTNSSVVSAEYTLQALPPTITPTAGTYHPSATLKLTPVTSGSSCFLSVDGGANWLTAPRTITSSSTVLVKATKAGWEDSVATNSYTYTILGSTAVPTFSVAGGLYTHTTNVQISCATAGVTIQWTTNAGATWHTGTSVYVGASCTLQAKAFKTGMTTATATAIYTITGTVATPAFNVAAGTYTHVTNVQISCAIPGATIQWTTNNGVNWNTGSTALISGSCTLQAKATKLNWLNSGVASASYTITGKVVTPTFSVAAGLYTHATNVQISSSTPGVSMQWSTNSGLTWHNGITATITHDCTLQAKATKSMWLDSDIGSVVYRITGTVATPTYSVAAGTYTHATNVQISCATPGATIQWTTNDGVNWYSSNPVVVSKSCTLKAKATKIDWADSAQQTASYEITGTVVMPTLSVPAGTYTRSTNVQISCATPGATIQWSTDGGSSWNTGNSVLVESGLTLQAKAVKSGWIDSAIVSASYSFKVATPTFSLASGTYSDPQVIQVNCDTPGVTFYYSISGGTNWSTGSTISLEQNMTLLAKAVHPTITNVAIATNYYLFKMKIPQADSPAGIYLANKSVALSCASSGATVQWSTNGGSSWNSGTTALLDVSRALQVRAVKSGCTTSDLLINNYQLRVPPPIVDKPTGGYYDPITVGLSSSLAGTSVYYSVNNGVTWQSGLSVAVSGNTTVKVKATKYGCLDSDIVTRRYSFLTYFWTKVSGSSGAQCGQSICADSSGNLYITGYFEGTVDFNPNGGVDNKTSVGAEDIFITKINSDGSYGWTRVMGGISEDKGKSVCVDGAGNVYISGVFRKTVNFDSSGSDIHTTTGGRLFVTKINSDGSYGWTKTFSASSEKSMCVDSSGNLYITGSFFAADFDPGVGVDNRTSVGGLDIFITKINSDGSYGWTKTMGGAGDDRGAAICTDINGNLYISGTIKSESSGIDLDPGLGVDIHNITGSPSLFMTKINSDGSYGWSRVIDNYYAMFKPKDICVDNAGNIYLSGGFIGYAAQKIDFNFGAGVDFKSGGYGSLYTDAFVTKINNDGSYGWTGTFGIGGSKSEYVYGVCTDSSGNVYLTGFADGTMDYNPNEDEDIKHGDFFITRLNNDGSYGWTTAINYGSARDICMDNNGNIFATGVFAGSTDFNAGNGVDQKFGTSDGSMFIMKIGQQ